MLGLERVEGVGWRGRFCLDLGVESWAEIWYNTQCYEE